jgi:hypothetical protein
MIVIPPDKTLVHPVKVWKGEDPLAPVPEDAQILDRSQLGINKTEAEIEKSWERIKTHINLWEGEERRHQTHVRKELLRLLDRYNQDPELPFFLDSKTGNPYKSFENFIHFKDPELYNKLDIQFRAARLERDLGIPIGTLPFRTLSPLFFAAVYKSRSLKGGYGTTRNEERFAIQKEAFELACLKAGVERVCQPELKKLKYRYVTQAVNETKAKYRNSLDKSKPKRKRPYEEIEQENEILRAIVPCSESFLLI